MPHVDFVQTVVLGLIAAGFILFAVVLFGFWTYDALKSPPGGPDQSELR